MGMGVALFAVAASSLPALVGTANPVMNIIILGVSGLCIGYGYAGAMVCAQAMIARQVAEGRQATALALQQNAIDVGIASASALYGGVFSALGPSAAEPFLFQACFVTICGVVLVAVRSGSRDDSKGSSA